MTLLETIRKKKFATATDATVATHTHQVNPNVAKVASVAVANLTDEKIESVEIKMIRAWLGHIQEPIEDHHLVISKCLTDPDALAYFLKHAKGGFERT